MMCRSAVSIESMVIKSDVSVTNFSFGCSGYADFQIESRSSYEYDRIKMSLNADLKTFSSLSFYVSVRVLV